MTTNIRFVVGSIKMTDILLEIKHLVKTYEPVGLLQKLKQQYEPYPSISNINLSLYKGESLGLIGESGSGKTTLGKCLVKLETITSGNIHLFGQNITRLNERKFRSFRKNIQMIFQDLDAALNPNMKIHQTLKEVLARHQTLSQPDLDKRLLELMIDVNLEENILYRYPSELSGGQKRRIAIAAVLAINPKIIIADEPTTGLDSYTQTLIMQLLANMQKRRGLSILFISHDLQLVKQYCQRIAVLYLGNIVEIANTEKITSHAAHPYTRLLWNTHLGQRAHTKPENISHDIRSGLYDYRRPQTGCQFSPRCDRYKEMGKPAICTSKTKPKLTFIGKNHQVACHFQLV